MAKENENLESTEETVEEVVADKDAEQEHLDRQKEEEESIALASEKAKDVYKRQLPATGEKSTAASAAAGAAMVTSALALFGISTYKRKH